MKSLKRISLLIAIVPLITIPATAQDDIDKFFQSSVDDAEKLVHGYISPFMKSVSSGLNQGWYNTAKPHKVAGFDLTFTVNAMGIPKDELFYDVSKLGLERVRLESGSTDYPNAPTIFGPDREPEYEILDEDGEPTGETFAGPPGIDPKGNFGIARMPVPMAHLGFGLPKGFDLKLRFVPKIDLGEGGQLNLWGIGVMHDIKQWIPGLKLSPIDLSAFVGYTKFKMTATLDEPDTENARGVFEMSAFTVQGIVSKKISVLTLYGGAGFNVANSKLAMLGRYDLGDDTNGDPVIVTDPIDLSFAASGPRITAGFRLKLAILTLHTDYTLQKYSCLSVGLGFAVR